MLTKATFGSILDANKGIGLGFDALRVTLSISILCFHSASITGDGSNPQIGLTGYVSSLLVPAFFAVSGFLVIASAIRVESLSTFLIFRGLRILPALFTEVVITAMIVGPLATNLSWSAYFSDPEFFRYFRNLIGDVHFYLPGVFTKHPMKAVNGSLWTIRPEIVCYLALALILLAQRHKSLTFHAALTAILFVVMLALSVFQSSGPWGMTFAAQAKYFFYFIAGNLFYHLRYYIPFRFPLFAIAAVVGVTLLQFPGLEILAAFPVIYCTIYAGLVPLPMLGIFSRGDYSYGIYLFAYPIQQLIASFEWTRIWYLNILIALPITVGVAALSWHWIEKPFMSLKGRLRISQKRESAILHYPAVRFVIAFFLICYGLAVSAWAGLFNSLGMRLTENVIPALLFSAVAAFVVAMCFRRHGLVVDA